MSLTLRELINPTPNDAVKGYTLERDTCYRTFLGACSWLKPEPYLVLNWALDTIGRRWMDKRQNIQAVILDACPKGFNIDCADADGRLRHPPGTHKSGYTVDLCYYTTGAHNCTQTVGDVKRIELFDANGQLLLDPTGKFWILDVERNFELYCILFTAFPKGRCHVDARIGKRIIEWGKNHRKINLSGWTQCDDLQTSEKYNHWGHGHMVLEGTCNWDVVLRLAA